MNIKTIAAILITILAEWVQLLLTLATSIICIIKSPRSIDFKIVGIITSIAVTVFAFVAIPFYGITLGVINYVTQSQVAY